MQNKKIRDERPELVVAALQQLRVHGVLTSALAGRQGNQLKQIINFVTTNFFKPSFFDVLYDAANVILCEYFYFNTSLCDICFVLAVYVEEDLTNPELSAVRELRNFVRAEIACQRSLLRCFGVIDSLLMAAAEVKVADGSQEDDIFGQLSIKPKIFSLVPDGQPTK